MGLLKSKTTYDAQDAQVSRHRRFIGVAVAIGITAGSFLSQGVLAENAYMCKHNPAKDEIVYTYNGKSRAAGISHFSGQFGKLVSYYCSEDSTFLLFEKGLVRAGGGARVIKTGELSMPFPGDPTKVIEGSVLDIFEGTAVKGRIEWGTVAVVILDSKSILVIKRINERKASQLQTPVFPDIDLKSCEISVTGDLQSTKVGITSKGFSKTLIIEGTTSENMVWK
ncbi:MAG: hypothetical protein QW500_02535 [Candidatus Micrarchaeia archaeon]